ncbi:SIMPL domain-containing protein [Paracoccus luteus]|uniref:SIMPL domain-containing protein n=1 Tax=Paracoccus luteus TaxID=2508543 RepID=UPI001FE3D0FF|nr:SIMPL domain-containing protein [Paracoccus luteus]
MILPPTLSARTSLTRTLAMAAATLALAAAPAVAGPGGHPKAGCGPAAQLSVTGEGQAGVAPDMAQVSLGVTTQAQTAAQALADNSTRQAAVLAALTTQGVAERDIQTSGLNLSPMQDYSREGQPPVITGYQAQNIVTVRVRDLARLGAVLDGLVTAGANEVQGIAFSREDRTATEDEARGKAVENARHRAEVLAGAAGMRLGRLISLGDTGSAPGPMPAMMMARDAKAESVPIATGELTITAQVSATWAMLPEGADGDCPMPGGAHGGMHGPGKGDGHGMMHGHGAPGMPGGPHPMTGDAPGSQPPAPNDAPEAPQGATPKPPEGAVVAPSRPAPAPGAAQEGTASPDAPAQDSSAEPAAAPPAN